MSNDRLSHLDDAGAAHMVDISGKTQTDREAVAVGTITTDPQTIAILRAGKTPKGDVIATARIAAIQAVKKTSELIPLCHPLPVTGVTCDFAVKESEIDVRVKVKTTGQTGVEMEALTGCCVALLTLYDMLKAVDKSMVIGQVMVLEKKGGKSGDYERGKDAP
ncbi:MAG: cyclic pyranopterin monophosphate synthase MoaC [Pseudomonadota bacterium]